MKHISLIFILFVAFLFSHVFAQDQPIKIAHHHESSDLTFIPNQGQWHQNVLFRTGIVGGHAIYLEEKGFTFAYLNQDDLNKTHDIINDKEALHKHSIRGHATRVHFEGANAVFPKGKYDMPGTHNYFQGNDPAKWASNVPLYKGVKYEKLYSGVDLFVHSSQKHFKYDFIVAAGADPNQIRIRYEGHDGLAVVDGDLVMQTTVTEIIERKPFAYQQIDGKIVEVACEYELNNDLLTFHFPKGYNTDHELTIDPVLVAATLSGTSSLSFGQNYGHCAAFDDMGNIFTGAISFGPGYPTNASSFQQSFGGGSLDIAVSKFSPDGSTLIYATYLGGSGSDRPHSLITDAFGNLYVYGSTDSPNYPTTLAAYDRTFNGGGAFPEPDIIISKLNPSGSVLMGSTFIGGTGADGQTQSTINILYGEINRGEIVLDDQGNVYIASCSASNNFPTSTGAYQAGLNTTSGSSAAQDAVIFKMTTNLSQLTWSTYLGGSHEDAALGLRLDTANHVYVVGVAGHSNFPTTTGAKYTTFRGGQEDGFVAKISNDGQNLLYSTFWGQGTSDEHTYFIDLDSDGNPTIYGASTGTMTPSAGTYRVLNSKQYIAALTPQLDSIIFQTVVGAGGASFFGPDFVPAAFLVDKCDNIFFSGYSAVANMPTTTGSFNFSDGFYLGVLDPLGSGLHYATYYGNADHVDGGTSRFSKDGIVYQATCSGSFSSMSTTTNAYATSQSTSWDIGVFKIDFELKSINSNFVAGPSAVGCAPFTVNFTNTGDTATSYRWYFGDGDSSLLENPIHTFTTPDTFDVVFIAIDSTTCNLADTTFLQVIVHPSAGTQIYPDTACAGDPISLLAQTTGGISYRWHDGSMNTFNTVSQGPGPFYVDVSIAGCTYRDSFPLHWRPLPTADFTASGPLCLGGNPSNVQFVGGGGPAPNFYWDIGSGTPAAPNGPGPFPVNWATQGNYIISLVVEDRGCFSDTFRQQVLVGPEPLSPVQVMPTELCAEKDMATINYWGSPPVGASFHWSFDNGNVISGAGAGPYQVRWDDPGSKQACLQVEWEGCFSDTTCIPITVFENPKSDFVSDSICLGENTAFLSTTIEGSGPIDQYRWNFGDMRVDVGNDPTHRYTTAGEYSVRLIVIDINGCTDTFRKPIVVWPTPNANFNPEELCMGRETQFIDKSSVDAPGQITSYRWDLDRGGFSDVQNPSHTYPRNDRYGISLEVLTQHGCFDRVDREITVSAVPFANFNSDVVCVGDITTFNNLSTFDPYPDNDRIVSNQWDFGDGSTSADKSPEHKFRRGGSFQVSLIAISGQGCRDTVTQQVNVYEKPTFRFLSDTTVCPLTSAIVYARPHGNASVRWFGNPGLSDFLGEGNSHFVPKVWWRDTLYVKAWSTEGCASNKEKVMINTYPQLNANIELSSNVVEMPNSSVQFSVMANRDIQSYLWDFGDGIKSDSASPSHLYLHPKTYPVTVEVSDVYGCKYLLEEEVGVEKSANITVPSAFTPNEDGFNDEFYLGTHNYVSLQFRVFNRWGQLIYETDNLDFRWNGKSIKGGDVPEGVYVYVMKAVDVEGVLVEDSGTITVIR